MGGRSIMLLSFFVPFKSYSRTIKTIAGVFSRPYKISGIQNICRSKGFKIPDLCRRYFSCFVQRKIKVLNF